MRKFAVVMLMCVGWAGVVFADKMAVEAPTPAEVAAMPVDEGVTSAEAAPVEVGNKICPVSKEEVGKDGMKPQKITYQGKVYNLCCGMCAKDFLKDPAKYIKIVEEEMKAKG